MNCNCIERIDQQLAEQNFALDTSFLLGKDLSLSAVILSVGTHWKDSSKKVRGKRPPTIVVTFCPFCGVKATNDEKEKENATQSTD